MWPFADVWLEPASEISRSRSHSRSRSVSPLPAARRYRRKKKVVEEVKVVRTQQQHHHQHHQHHEHRVLRHQRREPRTESVSLSPCRRFTRCCLELLSASLHFHLKPVLEALLPHLHLPLSSTHTSSSSTFKPSPPHTLPSTTTLHNHNGFHHCFRRLRALAR